MELRGVLESHAARLVIERPDRVPAEQDAGNPRPAGQTARDTTGADDAREFIRLDTLFHQQLIDAAGNELISRTYSKLHVRQILVGRFGPFPGRRQASSRPCAPNTRKFSTPWCPATLCEGPEGDRPSTLP
jgi:DNA-binding GntR family transcriptional regulator